MPAAGRPEQGGRRCAAFDNANVDERSRALVDKVTKNAWKVTDEDVAAVHSLLALGVSRGYEL